MSNSTTATIETEEIVESYSLLNTFGKVIKKESLKNASIYIFEKAKSIVFACIGLTIFCGFWSLLSYYTKDALPGPTATLTVLFEMLSDPFYDYGPNDKGIGLQLFVSIKTVLLGFSLGSLFAMPF